MCICNWVSSLVREPFFCYGIWFYFITGIGTLATWLWGFHLDMFISVWGLTTVDILWIQFVFAVWNVLNDIIAGYLSDYFQYKFGGRLILLIPFNIVYCLSTALPFYNLNIDYRLHYLLSISLFDGFLSFCAIITSAVWVDNLTANERDRLKISLVSKPIGFVVGFIISWTSYYSFDKDDLSNFYRILWIAMIISVVVTIVSYFVLSYLIKKHSKMNQIISYIPRPTKTAPDTPKGEPNGETNESFNNFNNHSLNHSTMEMSLLSNHNSNNIKASLKPKKKVCKRIYI